MASFFFVYIETFISTQHYVIHLQKYSLIHAVALMSSLCKYFCFFGQLNKTNPKHFVYIISLNGSPGCDKTSLQAISSSRWGTLRSFSTPLVTEFVPVYRSFRLVVRCSFVFASSNSDWLK